jgi:hypothetical protein
MRQVLSQTIWQSMLSGDFVNVPRKNKTALAVQSWGVPMFWCGNQLPNYRDNTGSVTRRLATFKFEKVVKKRDVLMQKKIEQVELVPILLRCLTRYHELRERYPAADFWKFAPRRLRQNRAEASEETNYLANFIANGDDFYTCVYEEGAKTKLSDLKAAFMNHMKFRNPDIRCRWTSDYHPLRARGFMVSQVNICKVCDRSPAVRSACGEHWNDGKNRKKLKVIDNMRLVKLKRVNVSQ